MYYSVISYILLFVLLIEYTLGPHNYLVTSVLCSLVMSWPLVAICFVLSYTVIYVFIEIMKWKTKMHGKWEVMYTDFTSEFTIFLLDVGAGLVVCCFCLFVCLFVYLFGFFLFVHFIADIRSSVPTKLHNWHT